MSSEIWKIGQQTNAQNLYASIKDGIKIGTGELLAVKHLTNICDKMSEAFGEIIDDQNEYLIEIEGEAAELESLKDDIDEKLIKLYNEIKAQEKKEQDGSITEEEKQELEAKKSELKAFMKDSDSKIAEKSESFKSKDNTKLNESKSKMSIAKNYGEVTVEKGSAIADSEYEVKLWFGGSVRLNTTNLGKTAVDAGNNLLDKVETSLEINDKINENNRVFKEL